MRKCIIFLLISLYILHSTFYIPVALATDSSSSADLETKLSQLKAEIASKAAQIKKEVDRKLENKFYMGILESSTDTQITLNNNQIILTNKYTDFEGKGDFVIGLGDINDAGALVARKVVRGKKPKDNSLAVFWGKITEASPSAFKVLTSDKKTRHIVFDKDTSFLLGNKDGSSKDLGVGKSLVISGETKEATTSARFIYIFPGVSTKPASPSAVKK